MSEDRSFYALRRGHGAPAAEWWRSMSRRADLPKVLAPLAAGRTRVELDRRTAAEALDWVEDRSPGAAVPVVVYPDDPRRLDP